MARMISGEGKRRGMGSPRVLPRIERPGGPERSRAPRPMMGGEPARGQMLRPDGK
jgi:hypothetical protein